MTFCSVVKGSAVEGSVVGGVVEGVVEGNVASAVSLWKVELPKAFRKPMGIAPWFLQTIPYVVIAIKTITAYVTTATLRQETSIVVTTRISIALQ